MKTWWRRLWIWAAALAALGSVGAVAAPEAAAIGLLIPNTPELPPLAIKSHRVTIEVTDRASVTRVEQEFINHTDRQLEATFVFALPPGSTVSDFSLWINGKKTPGAVLEKDKAREIYEGIVRRAQDPGLIEYMDGTLFQARIFPVPARGTQKIEIAYASVLDQTGSLRHLSYPLKTGRSAARLMEDFTLVAHLTSKAPLQAIYSPSHKIGVSRKSDHDVTVSFEKDGLDLERDFDLYVGTGGDDVGLSLLSYDPDGSGGEDGYFLMVLSPRTEIQDTQIPAKAVTFVIDSSGSMIGEKMEQAKAALAYCVQKLRPVDRFNVVRFSTDVEPLFTGLQPATPERIKEGLAFANRMEASGGTAIDEALAEALKAEVRDMPHLVLFLTDGRPTVGQTDVGSILEGVRQRNRANARIFAFGVGYDLNTTLLDRLAEDHNGSPEYVRPQEDIEVKVSALYNKIAYPVLADLNLDYGGAAAYDVYPRRLPDLFRGGQVVVLGRHRKPLPNTLRLTGRTGSQALTFEFDETGGASPEATRAHDFIPKLWATRKVGYLLSEIRAKGEITELKDEIIRLAKRFGLVTPYTSYLAVDDSELQNNVTPPPVQRPPVGTPVMPGWGGVPEGGDGGNWRGPNNQGLEDADEGERLAPRDPAPANAPPEEPAAVQSGRGESGRATGARPKAEPKKPAEVVIRDRKIADKRVLEANTGKDAVDASEATKELRRVEHSGETATAGTRHVDGRLFVLQSGVWRQDGVADKGAIKVKYLSPAWFNLAAAHPELKASLALGPRLVITIGKQVVVIGDEGKDKLSVEEIRRW